MTLFCATSRRTAFPAPSRVRNAATTTEVSSTIRNTSYRMSHCIGYVKLDHVRYQHGRSWEGWTMRLIAALFVGLFAVNACARLVPLKDPLDGVLDADLVIIVGPSLSGKPGLFRIKEVFLGDQHVGDSIDLGDFKLSITQQWGPPIIEPFTPTTRILLFLQRTVDSPTLWKPTYFGESYFWVQRFEDEALLRRAAERAVD